MSSDHTTSHPTSLAEQVAAAIASQDVTQLTAMLTELFERTEHNTQQATAAQALAAQASQTAQATARQVGQQQPHAAQPLPVKPPKPSKFNGSRNQEVAVWLNEMERYFSLSGVGTMSYAQLAAAYLEHKAGLWFQSWCTSIGDPSGASITWNQFCDAIKKQYRPVNANQQARLELRSLKQKGKVSTYDSLFDSLMLRIDNMGEPDKIENYIFGLKPRVRYEVSRQNPTTLLQAKELASIADQFLFYASQTNGKYNGPLGMDTSNKIAETSTTDTETIAYIDQQTKGKNTREYAQLPKKVLTYCMKHQLCLRCKKPGHRANECKNEKQRLDNKLLKD